MRRTVALTTATHGYAHVVFVQRLGISAGWAIQPRFDMGMAESDAHSQPRNGALLPMGPQMSVDRIGRE